MSIGNATPALLSLNIRRTAEAQISLIASDKQTPSVEVTRNNPKGPPPLDHTEELRKLTGLMEQQCFSFVAFRNRIRDARLQQSKLLQTLHKRADSVESKLKKTTSIIFQRLNDMKQRIDIISNALCSKPLFKNLIVLPNVGRITGLASKQNTLAATCSTGHFITIDKNTWQIVNCVKPCERDALFRPCFLTRNSSLACLMVSAGRQLFLALPFDTIPVQCVDEKVESFDVCTDPGRRDGYDIVTGYAGGISFYAFNPDDTRRFVTVAGCEKAQGIVTHVLCDHEKEVVYAITNRRFFHCVSTSSFSLTASKQFDRPLIQVALSTVFVVVASAPDDIMLMERCRERVNILKRFTIDAGFRCFTQSSKYLIVLTKQQTVEQRALCQVEKAENICEPDISEYDEDLYMGTVLSDETNLYLTHDDEISIWS